jgi:tRNA(fMet)-specific endonuclease VapC
LAVAPNYLLDTNIASFIIKGNVPNVRVRLRGVPMSSVALSVVTQAELLYGVARKPSAKNLQTVVHEFLLCIQALPWDNLAATHYARLRAALERSGKPMGNMDMLIAAHALSLDAVLVTSDAVFNHIDHLRTEDWTTGEGVGR